MSDANHRDAGKGALVVLFLVTMIDMIGFGIVIAYIFSKLSIMLMSFGILK